MKKRQFLRLISIALLAFASPCVGATPFIQSIFPRGGRQGSEVTVSIRGKDLTGASRIRISGSGVSGTVLESSDSEVRARITIAADAPAARRDLRVFTPNGSFVQVFEVGSLPEVMEAEPNNDLAKAQPVELPLLVNGQVTPADYDHFRFRATAGETLVFDLSSSRSGTRFDTVLTLLDASGREIASEDDTYFDKDPRLIFRVPSSGEYTVRVWGFREAGSAESEYRLSMGELPAFSHVFPAGGRRGETVQVTLHGVNLHLVDAVKLDGTALPGQIIAKQPETLKFRLALPRSLNTGLYRLRLSTEGKPLSYTLPFAVSDTRELVIDTPPVTPVDLSSPLTINGTIGEPNQTDNFLIDVKAGDEIMLEADAMALGNFLDPALTIFDTAGEVVAYLDETAPNGFDKEPPNIDVRLVHKFSKSGRYRVELRDAGLRGAPSFVYRLLAGHAVPDFEVYARTNQLSVLPGQKAEVPVRVRRFGGWNTPVRVWIEGLPPQIESRSMTAEPVNTRFRGTFGEDFFFDGTNLEILIHAHANAAPGVHTLRIRASGVINGKTIERAATVHYPWQETGYLRGPSDDGELMLTVAQPKSEAALRLSLHPATAHLRGTRARQALAVTAIDAKGLEQDVTAQARFEISTPGVFSVTAQGVVAPVAEGKSVITASFQGATATAEISVSDLGASQPLSFLRDVAPILTERGCTGSNCHGSVRGKAGFKLSLFGGRPDLDFEAVTKASEGRRINTAAPDKSLLLLKPTALMAHGGGLRFKAGSPQYETILNWLQTGVAYDSGGPQLVDISAYPEERILTGAGATQRLIVTGRYSDQAAADLTAHVRYSSNDESIAQVSDSGIVTAKRPGETSIMIRTQGKTAVARIAVIPQVPGNDYPDTPQSNFIDELVFAKLKRLDIRPSPLADDSTFVRRAYTDVLGVLPTAEETRRFLAAKEADKRARLIDELLARPEFVDVWTMKFADLFQAGVTGIKGGWQLYRWLHRSLEQDKPYDAMVRELLLGAGSFVYDPTVNFYAGLFNGPEGVVTQVSQSLLGVRMDCAKCHDHPFERWTQDDFYGIAGFFSRLQRKHEPYGLFENAISLRPDSKPTYDYLNNNKEVLHPRTKASLVPRYLGGETVVAKPGVDVRRYLADWLTSPKNPWFSRAIANRIWRHFMGRAVVEPVDDFRVTNPPSNPKLLDALAEYLASNRFSLKTLTRAILNSRAYQLSSATIPSNENDSLNYSRYYLKRRTAEELFDALGQAAETRLKIPGYPQGARAIGAAVGSPNYFLTAFGKAGARDQICERDHEPDVAQAMHLINGDTIQKLITTPGNIIERVLGQADWTDKQRMEEIYLTVLSRYPTEKEASVLLSQSASATGDQKKQFYQDLLWAIFNSKEFTYVF